jgi:DNA-directed RNA polymerase sigma subunit (sigma70/sigma32)
VLGQDYGSINAPVYSDEGSNDGIKETFEDKTPSHESMHTEAVCETDSQIQWVMDNLGALNSNQRVAITLHFGLLGKEPKKYAEIGRELGVCRERARQIVTTAIDCLRNSAVKARLVERVA